MGLASWLFWWVGGFSTAPVLAETPKPTPHGRPGARHGQAHLQAARARAMHRRAACADKGAPIADRALKAWGRGLEKKCLTGTRAAVFRNPPRAPPRVARIQRGDHCPADGTGLHVGTTTRWARGGPMSNQRSSLIVIRTLRQVWRQPFPRVDFGRLRHRQEVVT